MLGTHVLATNLVLTPFAVPTGPQSPTINILGQTSPSLLLCAPGMFQDRECWCGAFRDPGEAAVGFKAAQQLRHLFEITDGQPPC